MTADLDLTMLSHAFDGSRENVALVLAAGLTSIQADARKIEQAASTSDSRALSAAAHRMKGTSGTIRASRLFAIVDDIAREARSESGSVRPAAITAMREAIHTLETMIATYEAGGSLD